MKRSLLTLTAASAFALGAAGTASADWSRSWVIEYYEPAMYYGAEEGITNPGTDCPEGTNPEVDWIQVMVEAGYTQEEAEWLRNPANPSRSPVHGQNQMAFRGEGRENVYMHPTSTPESGTFRNVEGTLAEGLNLDGDPSTGFTGLHGETGIDNEFYHAMGCWKTYRGQPREASGALSMNDSMRNGSWTVVIVASGEGADPMNDPNARLGIYVSDDPLVVTGNGDVAEDYTFAIAPHARYDAVFPVRVVDGVITSTEAVDKIYIREPSYTRELELLEAQLQFEMKEDGSLSGYLGGYRPWEPVYWGWVNARGPVIESLTWVRLPDVYYALQRFADYSPEGADGEKTHISFAMRVDAAPAFVMQPDASSQVATVTSFKSGAEAERSGAPVPGRGGLAIDGVVPSTGYPGGPDAEILPRNRNVASAN